MYNSQKPKNITMRQGDAFLYSSHMEIGKVHVKQKMYLHYKQKQIMTKTPNHNFIWV